MLKLKTLQIAGLFLSTLVVGLSSCSKPLPTAEETVKQASQLLELQKTDQAIAALEAYNTTHAGNREVLETLAFAYSRKPDYALAAITFAQLAEQQSDIPEYLLYAAESMASADDRAGAVDFYRKYLEQRPQEPAVWLKLAQHSEVLGRGPEAINALLQAYKLTPTADITLRLAALFQSERNFVQAKKWYETSVTYGGGFAADGLLGLFDMAMTAQSYTEAEAIAAQLEKEHPLRLETSSLAGLRDELRAWRAQQNEALRVASELAAKQAEEAETKKKEAEAAALALAESKPVVNADSINETATNTAWIGTIPSPVSDLADSAPTPAMMAASALSEARTYIQTGDYVKAATAYKQSLAYDDSVPLVWYELSQVYVAMGDDRYAEAIALEARRRAPNDSRYLYNYLQIARRTLNEQRYFDELISAHDKFPADPDLTLLLARAYLNLAQNRRNATILFREFLQLAPDHPEAEQVRRELGN